MQERRGKRSFEDDQETVKSQLPMGRPGVPGNFSVAQTVAGFCSKRCRTSK